MYVEKRTINRMTVAVLGLFAVAAVAVMLPPPAASQDVALGLRVYKQKANCYLCHGWAGDGDGAMDNPAPSIRTSALDRATIAETIRCGRPQTGMPYHFRDAYTNDVATSCYGLTEAALGAARPEATRAFLSAAEIEAVTEYVMVWILGRGAPTLEECEFYFGAGNVACTAYRN